MIICAGCKRELDYDSLMLMSGIWVCFDCLGPYEDLAWECQSLRDMDMLERLVRSDILRKNRKIR